MKAPAVSPSARTSWRLLRKRLSTKLLLVPNRGRNHDAMRGAISRLVAGRPVALDTDVDPEQVLSLGGGQACLRRRVAVLAQVAGARDVGVEREHADRLPGETGGIPPHVVERQRRHHGRIDRTHHRRHVGEEVGFVAVEPAPQPDARRQQGVRRGLEAVAEVALPHPRREAVDQAGQVDRPSPARHRDVVRDGRVVVVGRGLRQFGLRSRPGVAAGEGQRVGQDAHPRIAAARRAAQQDVDAVPVLLFGLRRPGKALAWMSLPVSSCGIHVRCGVAQVERNEQAHRGRQEAVDPEVARRQQAACRAEAWLVAELAELPVDAGHQERDVEDVAGREPRVERPRRAHGGDRFREPHVVHPEFRGVGYAGPRRG